MSSRGPDLFASLVVSTGKVHVSAYFSHLHVSSFGINDWNQPVMIGERWMLLFNGMIYNWRELAQKYDNSATCDTHALSSCIDVLGLKALSLLEGMFAIVLIDMEKSIVYACRDTFGQKPLYVTHHDSQGLYLTSRIDYLSAIKNFLPSLDPEYFTRFQKGLSSNPFLAQGITPYQEVSSLRCGSLYSWSFADKPIATVTPMVPVSISWDPLEGEQLRAYTERTLPTALLMSSGVDSNLLAVSLKKQHINFMPFTFCLPKSSSEVDESSLVTKLSANLGYAPEIVQIDESTITESFRDFCSTFEIFPDGLSCICEYLIYQNISTKGIRVAVHGQGADELFLGYNYIPAELRDISSEARIEILRHCLQSSMVDQLIANIKSYPLLVFQVYELYILSLPANLYSVDCNSMRFGVEARAPYLDPAVRALASAYLKSLDDPTPLPKKTILRERIAKADKIHASLVRPQNFAKLGFEAIPSSNSHQLLRRLFVGVMNELTDDAIKLYHTIISPDSSAWSRLGLAATLRNHETVFQ
jgi:asparagine synthase (glutamine-hydrolysing)